MGSSSAPAGPTGPLRELRRGERYESEEIDCVQEYLVVQGTVQSVIRVQYNVDKMDSLRNYQGEDQGINTQKSLGVPVMISDNKE